MKKIVIYIFLLVSNLFAHEDLLQIDLKPFKSSIISANITNTFDKTVELLKWNTMFEDEISADIFVVSKDKKEISYTGKMIKRGEPKKSDFVVFRPKETKSVFVDLSKYYNMEKSGEYSVSYRGNFQYKIANDNLALTYPKTKSIKFYFRKIAYKKISKKVIENFDKCSIYQKEQINEALKKAKQISKEAFNALDSLQLPTTAKRYKIWFGKEDESRQKIIKENFYKISDAINNKDIKFSCNCSSNSFAYVYANEPYNVYLCKRFFTAFSSGKDTKSGTLVHEISHFNIVADTDDIKYGQTEAKRLARNRPHKAMKNADNYEYFAENYPFLSLDEQGIAISPYENAQKIYLQNGLVYEKNGTFVKKVLDYFAIEPLFAFSMLELWSEGKDDTFASFYDNDKTLIDKNDDSGGRNYNFHIIQPINDKTKYLTFSQIDLKAVDYDLKIKNYVPDIATISLDENVEKQHIDGAFLDDKLYTLYKLKVPKNGDIEIIARGENGIKGFLYDSKLNILQSININAKNRNMQFKRKYSKGEYYFLLSPYKMDKCKFKMSIKYEAEKKIITHKIDMTPIISYLLN